MTSQDPLPSIRPSQVTRTFGPGSIYDNQYDSMIVMGTDYWDEGKFKRLSDPILIQEIQKGGLTDLKRLASTSSPVDAGSRGTIPVKSFPEWGFCPRCNKLVRGRGRGASKITICDSGECRRRERNDGASIPHTYPIRFVAACRNGHLDEFPWYSWVHRTEKEREKCGVSSARLFLKGNPKSLSLESRLVVCEGEGCIAEPKRMAGALSKHGLVAVMRGCNGRRPWLGDYEECDEQMRGIFKGATNLYFPIVRSAVTIPPFSGRLAEIINSMWDEIMVHKNTGYYDEWLVNEIRRRDTTGTGFAPDIIRDKIGKMEIFRNAEVDVRRLEFDALSSDENVSEEEFVTECLDVPDRLGRIVSRVVLVKKARIVSALMGFTRIDPPDPAKRHHRASLSRKPSEWLPAIENHGEGIFFGTDDDALERWARGDQVRERFGKMMIVQGRSRMKSDDPTHTPKYIFLHTLSHLIIRSLSEHAGYSIASFAERIYCGRKMSGILIYTYSPSSDGSLGGLVGLGTRDDGVLWRVIEDAIRRSARCSCDPLCSFQEIDMIPQLAGASCHACTLLPETCCEVMNAMLDRTLISHTMAKPDIGFAKDTL